MRDPDGEKQTIVDTQRTLAKVSDTNTKRCFCKHIESKPVKYVYLP